jgi:hypothetical protein
LFHEFIKIKRQILSDEIVLENQVDTVDELFQFLTLVYNLESMINAVTAVQLTFVFLRYPRLLFLVALLLTRERTTNSLRQSF